MVGHPVADMERVACAVEGISSQIEGTQRLQLHEVHRQVRDFVVREVQVHDVLRQLLQLGRCDAVVAEVEGLQLRQVQLVHLRQLVVRQVQLGDVDQHLELVGEFRQFGIRKVERLDGHEVVSTLVLFVAVARYELAQVVAPGAERGFIALAAIRTFVLG